MSKSQVADLALTRLADNNVEMMFGFLEYMGFNKKIQIQICSKLKKIINLPDATYECTVNPPDEPMNLLLRDLLNLYYINFANMPSLFTETLPGEIKKSICGMTNVSVRKQVRLLRDCITSLVTHLLEVIGKPRLYAKLLEVYKTAIHKEAVAKPLEDIVEEDAEEGSRVGKINGGFSFFTNLTKRIKDTVIGVTLKHRLFGDRIAEVIATKITAKLAQAGVGNVNTQAYIKGVVHDLMPQVGAVIDHIAKCSRISAGRLEGCVEQLNLEDLARGIVVNLVKTKTLTTVTNIITCIVCILINRADAIKLECVKPEYAAEWERLRRTRLSIKEAALLATRVVINGECMAADIKAC
jgi:hypothetical protein